MNGREARLSSLGPLQLKFSLLFYLALVVKEKQNLENIKSKTVLQFMKKCYVWTSTKTKIWLFQKCTVSANKCQKFQKVKEENRLYRSNSFTSKQRETEKNPAHPSASGLSNRWASVLESLFSEERLRTLGLPNVE